MALWNTCVLSSRTRSCLDPCSGKITKLNGLASRQCGFSVPVSVCRGHEKKQQVQNKSSCCYPFAANSQCGGALVSCPSRLFPVFDHVSNGKKGTFICLDHLVEADNHVLITTVNAYSKPKTRKVGLSLYYKWDILTEYLGHFLIGISKNDGEGDRDTTEMEECKLKVFTMTKPSDNIL